MIRGEAARADNIFLGVAMIVGGVFLMSFSDALVKLASADLSLWQIYVCRSLVSVPLLAAVLFWRRSGLRPIAPGWVYLRALLLVVMWVVYYAALPHLSLSVAATALYTAPLFIALFSALLIGEPVGASRWMAIAIGFAGVLAILRPGSEDFSWFMLLPILGAALYALAMVLTRAKCADEDPLGLSFSLNAALLAAGLIMTVVLMVADPSPELTSASPFLFGTWEAMGAREWGVVAVLGVLIAVYAACVAKAYQVASPAIVGTFDYTYMLFATGWGFVLFGDIPDAATLAGMVFIAAAGFLVLRAPRPVRLRFPVAEAGELPR